MQPKITRHAAASQKYAVSTWHFNFLADILILFIVARLTYIKPAEFLEDIHLH